MNGRNQLMAALYAKNIREQGVAEMEKLMRNKILIIDDVDFNRDMLRIILEEDYTIVEADNGRAALDIIAQSKDGFAAILLDLLMPEMDGFEVLKELSARGITEKIPVLIISGETSVETEKKCFEMGIADFIGKPFNNMLVKKRVHNAAEVFSTKNMLEEKVAEQTKVLRKACQALKIQAEQLKKRNQEIIDLLGTVVEYRDLESGEHIHRVKEYTRILAECFMEDYPEYGLTKEKIDVIVSASALHDIGKIAIPDSILNKKGRLTKDEYEYMKSHTTKGCELLDAIKSEWDVELKKASREICRYHHERYDGKGYPEGLSGDDIPVSAQLVSVADVYDALVNERCYKEAYSTEKAFRMIVNGECGVFSPRLMACFRKVRAQFEQTAANSVA